MHREIITAKNYQKAFACMRGENCPQRVGEEGCPMWSEIIKTNISNGEESFICGCYPQISLLANVEVIKASNRPAAAVESARNEIVRGFETLAQIAASKPVEEPKKVSAGFVRKMLGR